MNRRAFLSSLAAITAGATLDPERLLWRPGKLISIPRPKPTMFHLQNIFDISRLDFERAPIAIAVLVVAGWRRLKSLGMLDAFEVVLSGAAGLSASLVGQYIIALYGGAKALDTGRAAETSAAITSVKETAAELDSAKKQVQDLRGALARKHPHDEAREAHVRSCLSLMNAEEIEVVRRLRDSGELAVTLIHQWPSSMSAISKCGSMTPSLIQVRTVPPTNSAGEMRYFKINPNYEDALRNVLYPPQSATH